MPRARRRQYPARLDAQLFFLNGTMTDNWDGWIRDNGTPASGAAAPTPWAACPIRFPPTTAAPPRCSTATHRRQRRLARTRLQLHFGVDLRTWVCSASRLSGFFTNGRLTCDISNAKLSDLIKVGWDIRPRSTSTWSWASRYGRRGLPSILGDFHMTWMANNKNQYVQRSTSSSRRATTSCSRSALEHLVLRRLSGCRHLLHPLPEPHRAGDPGRHRPDHAGTLINALTTPIPACPTSGAATSRW